ncbi:MAG: hypothetical protein ACRD1T_08910 [Acidimicrobiia bacterium]
MDAVGTTSYLIPVYVVYSIVSIGLTIWLARTLYKSGEVFLKDVFEDKNGLAHAVNVLLVVGFYMLNFGYAALILRANAPSTGVGAIETLAQKLGVLIFTLGLIHFVNMMVFFAIRRRAEWRKNPPPVPPIQYWPAPQAGPPPSSP